MREATCPRCGQPVEVAKLAYPARPETPEIDVLDDLERRLAFALEARDVQQGGSPHITPGNRFYREAAAALMALMPPPARLAEAPRSDTCPVCDTVGPHWVVGLEGVPDHKFRWDVAEAPR